MTFAAEKILIERHCNVILGPSHNDESQMRIAMELSRRQQEEEEKLRKQEEEELEMILKLSLTDK